MQWYHRKNRCILLYLHIIAAYEGANSDPNAEYVPVPAPKVNAEDTVKLNMYYLLGPCITVSADSPNAELCVKWLDYLFSEEGALLANYGTEGDTFEYQEDGTQFSPPK